MATACNWLEDNRDGQPFFLYVDTFDPHEPWDPPQWYVDRYDPGYTGQVVTHPHYDYIGKFLTRREAEHCRALYAGEVTLVDRWIGRLLEKIDDMDLWDRTMILFTSDHGFLFGEHGIIGKAIMSPRRRWGYIPLYDQISHVPLVVSMPGGRSGRTSAVVQPADIMPTILEALGVRKPKTIQGESFLSVLRGKTNRHRPMAATFPHLGGTSVMVTVTEGRRQAILFPNRPPEGFDEMVYEVRGKTKLFRAGDRPLPDLLYDLKANPQADKDIAARHPEVLRRLRRRFVKLLRQCDTAAETIALWERGR